MAFGWAGGCRPDSLENGNDFYVKTQIDASYYQPVTKSLVMAGRARLAGTFGTNTQNIAPSRRYYSGGGGSIRGYGFQDVGPQDSNLDPIGGRSLTEFSLEARYRIGDFGIVPFVDAGNVYTESWPQFNDMRFGAGIGLRYYSSFGPLRFDVGFPINKREGDPDFGIYLSLGQAF